MNALAFFLLFWLGQSLTSTPEEPAPVAVVEVLPGGGRIEREVLEEPDGSRTAHGDYARFYADGTLQERGRFLHDKRVGTWEFFYANGERESVVRYRRGLRNGESRSWREDGSYVSKRVFEAEFASFDDGAPRFQGEWLVLGSRIRDGSWTWFWPHGGVRCQGTYQRGVRSGAWSWFWWDGAPQQTGGYERVRVDRQWIARRTGEWVFHHADGCADPEFLSGRYEDGARVGTPQLAFPAPDPASLPGLASYPGLSPEDERGIASSLGDLVSGDDARRASAQSHLQAWDQAALPFVLTAMRSALLAPGGEADFLLLRDRLPVNLAAQFAAGCLAEGVFCAEGAAFELRRWWTAWELFGERPDELLALDELAPDAWREAWSELLMGPVPDEAPALGRPTPVLEALDAGALEWVKTLSKSSAPMDSTELHAGLAWLAARQASDGSWEGDLLTTALSVRALVAGGSTAQRGEHAEPIARASDWLATHVPAARPLGTAAPTLAFSEGLHALAVSVDGMRNPALRRRIQDSIEDLAEACATAAAKSPEADTFDRLKAGAFALFGTEDEQFRVLPEHFQWIGAWLEPAALEGVELAARLSIRLRLGADPIADADVRVDAAALAAARHAGLSPREWLAGANALSALGGALWEEWREGLLASLGASQVADGPQAGSWAPAHGNEARERARATAIATLALAAAAAK